MVRGTLPGKRASPKRHHVSLDQVRQYTEEGGQASGAFRSLLELRVSVRFLQYIVTLGIF